MKEKKIDIKTLEDCLSDGMNIQNILDMNGGGFDALRVDTFKQTYMPNEDVQLNTDFRMYRAQEEAKFREKMRKLDQC